MLDHLNVDYPEGHIVPLWLSCGHDWLHFVSPQRARVQGHLLREQEQEQEQASRRFPKQARGAGVAGATLLGPRT
jgi:hypothetical protein